MATSEGDFHIESCRPKFTYRQTLMSPEIASKFAAICPSCEWEHLSRQSSIGLDIHVVSPIRKTTHCGR